MSEAGASQTGGYILKCALFVQHDMKQALAEETQPQDFHTKKPFPRGHF